MKSINDQAVDLHRKHQGKLTTASLVPVADMSDLALVYTPGVAAVSQVIHKNPAESFALTSRGRMIAVISDGSAVLGLGNIGPEAALPVMEGKSLLMKQFADVASIPLVIKTQETAEIINFVKLVSPSFAGINLEDISAPRCFEIEEALQDLGIPVFHDDQHGTATVVMAALLNAARVVGKPFESLKVVVVGAGAAGMAVSKMLLGIESSGKSCQKIANAKRVDDLIIVDSMGALIPGRKDMNSYKQALAKVSNLSRKSGQVKDVIKDADVVIGVSGPGSISEEAVQAMAPKAIVLALANPTPEIMPDEAVRAGAVVVATGRSDFPNQINNVLAFPGIFRAVVDYRIPRITTPMKQAAAIALANLIAKPTATSILPTAFDKRVVPSVAQAIKEVYVK